MTDQSVDPRFEAFLRSALADAVTGPIPTELPARAKRRVRLRQGMFSVAMAVVVVAIATVGASALGAFERDAYIEIAGERYNERGAGGTYPCDFKEVFGMPQKGAPGCIAYGSYNGLRWGLAADPNAGPRGEELCMMVLTESAETGGSAGSQCNEYLPGKIGMELQQPGSYPMMAAGYVPGSTTQLFVERSGDPPMELQLYPTPEELARGYVSYDLKFYLVWLPDDAEDLVAYDGEREIARRSIDGDPPERSTDASPPRDRVDVTRFRAAGTSFVLDVYGDELDGDDVACTRISPRNTLKKAGPCHRGFPKDNALSVAATVLKGPWVAIHGVVRSEVAMLWAETPGRERFPVEVIPAPEGIEPAISYFVFEVADAYAIDKPLTVIAEDARGNVIQERTIKLANDVEG